MEKSYTYIMIPFIFLLIFSCSIEAVRENLMIEGEHGFNFKESKSQWDELKERHGNSYEYSLQEQSWVGVGSETTIKVEDGIVVSRYYEAYTISDYGEKTIIDSYREESKKEIGSHESGAPPLTIDDLYKSCLSGYLIADPDQNTVYFETTEEGVIALCGYVPVGCVDDCFRGFKISHFSWL